MSAKIYYENLNKEYRVKLRKRELTKETIDALARSVSEKYFLQKRALKTAAGICLAVTLLLLILSVFSPAVSRGNLTVILISYLFLLFMEGLIFILIYRIIVTRIPRQFAAALKQGYPELISAYGYEAIIGGNLIGPKTYRQYPFSLLIEDCFRLQNSSDIVVTGFAHGLIQKGNSVYLNIQTASFARPAAVIVTGIETSPGTSVLRAIDCPVALRLQNGAELPIQKGRYLYRTR